VGLAGIVNIGLAIVAAYGLGGYSGLIFSQLMNILPFILAGIGVVRLNVSRTSPLGTSSTVHAGLLYPAACAG
jgi:hypothetical protein